MPTNCDINIYQIFFYCDIIIKIQNLVRNQTHFCSLILCMNCNYYYYYYYCCYEIPTQSTNTEREWSIFWYHILKRCPATSHNLLSEGSKTLPRRQEQICSDAFPDSYSWQWEKNHWSAWNKSTGTNTEPRLFLEPQNFKKYVII